jgi:hypothetical protein
MIVLNLFIGVIMNSMQEAAVETQRAEDERLRLSGVSPQATLEDDLAELQRAAEQLAARAVALQERQRESSSRESPRSSAAVTS